jgi:hypothetical protein
MTERENLRCEQNASNKRLVGGGLPGGYKMKLGDKIIDFRGAVGVGDDRRNFSAGVGVPF